MPRFFDALPAALAEGQPFALGIISGIKGSSPQKKGAKALFFADGRIIGTLGGGCLEAEVQDRARRALLSQKPATFDLVLDHDFGWDDGLICGGKVSGLILPNAADARDVWTKLASLNQPLRWGVRPDFTIAIQTPYRSSPESSPPTEVVQNPESKPPTEVATEVLENPEWLFEETVHPPCPLWIAGSGHIAQAVAPLAHQLDFQVTVFDDRPSLANHHYFPPTTHFRVDPWEKLLTEQWPDGGAAAPPGAASGCRKVFGLIVTRGHQHDALVLREWINRPFAFLGMIGSSRKKRLIFNRFLEQRIATEQQLNRVACPVGVSIDAVSVHEIALSIMAQYVHQRAAALRTLS